MSDEPTSDEPTSDEPALDDPSLERLTAWMDAQGLGPA